MENTERADLEAMAYWILSGAVMCPVCGVSLAGARLFSHIEEAPTWELEEIAIPAIMDDRFAVHMSQARGLRDLWTMIKTQPAIAEAFGR